MKETLKIIQRKLALNSNKAAAAAQQHFIPGVKTKIYGVRMPVLNDLAKEFKGGGFELVKELWDAGAYEERMLAVKMLGLIAKKDPVRSLELVKYFAPTIDNWAICDTIGMQALKPMVKSHQKEIFVLAKKLNSSVNFWERRLSLVLVEWYTRIPELHFEIKKLVNPLEKDPEYYVRKAVVWINKGFEKARD